MSEIERIARKTLTPDELKHRRERAAEALKRGKQNPAHLQEQTP